MSAMRLEVPFKPNESNALLGAISSHNQTFGNLEYLGFYDRYRFLAVLSANGSPENEVTFSRTVS